MVIVCCSWSMIVSSSPSEWCIFEEVTSWCPCGTGWWLFLVMYIVGAILVCIRGRLLLSFLYYIIGSGSRCLSLICLVVTSGVVFFTLLVFGGIMLRGTRWTWYALGEWRSTLSRVSDRRVITIGVGGGGGNQLQRFCQVHAFWCNVPLMTWLTKMKILQIFLHM